MTQIAAHAALILSGLGSLLLASGCPWLNRNQPDPYPYDGSWRITSTTTAAQNCVLIDEHEIVQFMDGCTGPSQPIVSAQPAAVSGDTAVWRVRVAFPGQGDLEIEYVYSMVLQPDGTFSGTEARTFITGGQVSTPQEDTVLMVRE